MKENKKIEIIKAYDETKDNVENIKASNMCGCYTCLNIFEASKVKAYVDNSAVCPYCGEQSLIPDVDIELTDDFLLLVNKFWI